MEKLIFIIFGLVFLCITNELAVAGEAFESLLAVASADATLPVVFDGAAPSSIGLQPVLSQPVNTAEPVRVNNRQRQAFFTMPVPAPVDIKDLNLKSNRAPLITTIDEKTERSFINKGIAALAAATSGEPLVEFLKTEGVVIKWETRAYTDKEPPYARACPPDECIGKKVIYLNDIKTKKNGVEKKL